MIKLKLHKALVLFTFFIFGASIAQDTINVHEKDTRNQSIADKFTLYQTDEFLTFEDFEAKKNKELIGKKLRVAIENLDFTSSTYFIDFVLVNDSDKSYTLDLETARPITNTVDLYSYEKKAFAQSGDAIPFQNKATYSNKSVHRLIVPAQSSERYILRLSSDGEIISLPIIFWDAKTFKDGETRRQFVGGIFYGIFLFVIIIYLTFYVQLRDSLFLLYSLYVLFSGMLQFSLDGYMHQYVFTSGGYMTQHIIIISAGFTVFFVLQYAMRYLELKGRTRKITSGFSWVVMATIVGSLIPGALYKISYPLINGFSLLALVYLIFIAFRLRKSNTKISPLFFIGLITLFLGAIVFILGNFSVIDFPVITQNALKTSTLIEIICLSILMAGKYRTLQEEKEVAQKRLLVELEEKNKIVSEANVRLEAEVEERTKEIESQRLMLKEKNEDFVSSIKYAERIQSALLSNEKKFKSILSESFVMFRPKDIVSGDFYWIEEIEATQEWPNGLIVYATADCTGHGVPGAFVSIICNNLLKLGKNHKDVQNPGQLLDFVNREINEVLNSNYNEEQIRDGMDISLCAMDLHNHQLYFSGAKNGMLIVRDGEIIQVKGDRVAIGNTDQEQHRFETQLLELKKGDMLYTFSDGYVDQFGGPDQKKFMAKRLKEMFINIADKSLPEQQEVVENTFEIWKEDVEQIDDVLVVAVRI